MKPLKIILINAVLFCLLSSNNSNNTTKLLSEYIAIKYPNLGFNNFIYVGIKRQKLYYIENGKLALEFDISTAKNGAGNRKGSEKTPIGLHEIRHKIGENVPLGGVFNHKKFNNQTANINHTETAIETDYILTRIMSLKGLEDGVNKGKDVDSYARAIYIHGTADEGLIGKPASHGCVRMKNEEIIELFNSVDEGTKVILFNN